MFYRGARRFVAFAPALRSSALYISVLCISASAQTPAAYATPHAPLLGAVRHSEQWPESQWEQDLQLMQDAHFNVTPTTLATNVPSTRVALPPQGVAVLIPAEQP